jgi:hypothetical protein
MRFNIIGNLINPDPNGLFVRHEDHARALESRVLAERKEPVAQWQTKLRDPILPECDTWINVSEEGARKAMEKWSHIYEVRALVVAAHPTPDDAADAKRWKWASASTENADALMTFLIQHSGGNRDGFLVDVDSAIDRATQDANSSSVAESNICAAQDDASTDHKFAIIKDRHYDGEGLTLWVWDGRYYCGTDGDCLLAHPDGSLDGFDCEWLTHYQLEQRLNAAIDRAMQSGEEGKS